MNETGYLQLHLAKGIGPATMRQVLTRLTQTGTSLDEFLCLSAGEQVARFGLARQQAQALQAARAEMEKTHIELQQCGVKLLACTAPEYPTRLQKRLGDHSPPLLYTWGNLDLLHKKAVGFCGARDVSEQGLAVAEDCAEQIVDWDWIVVSGGARGVDTTVHRTALAAGGGTIIVLPEGILRYRLRSDLRLLITQENALLISEFPPYMSWSVDSAMQRNRTVCGLSDALIVIEAGTSGGTFEAGKLALRLKMPLFVADYAEPAASAAGNAYFLARGACALRRSAATGRANLEPLRRVIEAPSETTLSAVQERLF
jgi:DNA protecting protein DprA